MFSLRAVMAWVYLFGVQGTGGLVITPNAHIFSSGQRPLKAMQEALTAAMATKKLGAAFGLETNDIFLPLPDGMATQLGLPEGTVLHATRMRMDKSGEVILEGTLAGKNLESEKNFILVGSASDMAATLGQQNDTKGAQLLLVQEKDGFRAVTYLPDGNEKGNIRVLSESTGLNPATVRAALNKSELVGGLGAKPGILERAAESVVETTKKAVESIPGGETIMKKVVPGSKETKPARPTEKLEEKPAPKSLFEQLKPFFEKAPGSPLPMPRGLSPLKVNGDALGELYASAKDVLGAWDFDFTSAPDDETVADKTPIVVATSKTASNTQKTTSLSTGPSGSSMINEAVTPKGSLMAEEKDVKPELAVTEPEAKGFWSTIKSKTTSYMGDVKVVMGFVGEKAEEAYTSTKGAIKDSILATTTLVATTKEMTLDTAEKSATWVKDLTISTVDKTSSAVVDVYNSSMDTCTTIARGAADLVTKAKDRAANASISTMAWTADLTVKFYREGIRSPGVTFDYRQENQMVAGYYHEIVPMVSITSGYDSKKESIGGYPEVIVLTQMTKFDVAGQAVLGEIPIIGTIVEAQKKIDVGEYRSAAIGVGIDLLAAGPKLAKGIFKLSATAVKSAEGVIEGVDKSYMSYNAFNDFQNLAADEITMKVMLNVLHREFDQFSVPVDNRHLSNPHKMANGDLINYPRNSKAKMQVGYTSNGALFVSIPVGPPRGEVFFNYSQNKGPEKQVVNLYGIEVSKKDVYRLAQDISREVFKLYYNDWKPMGGKYENEILKILSEGKKGF